ncbi:calcium uptake protein 3, mitochondrial isoform X2 [Chiloscyllium plagiosum]|uniref:calcium uptake protein 3, mitochondrial isoform X2 n=1 Tax=Chiloscyllium plagiosum TaxID=36176 RepID=UPI001CB7FFC2|nr:calcium uptake protein 3, mitochondrial isoform X2 [Chiloscyllium plagiosum]
MAALRALMRLQLVSGASRRGSTFISSLRSRRPAVLAAAGGAAVASCCCCYYYYRHSSSSPESGSATRRERRYRLGLPSGDVFAPLSVPTVEATGRAKNVVEESDIEDVELYVSSQEQRFRLFTSLEHEGQLYMTPRDFIESVTTDEPRGFRPRKSLSKQELENMLAETPPVWKGSSRLFRTLHDRGLIAYTEYLFLLCILTKPHAGFKIAFNMFDTDGNEMVDKKEFLVLQEIFRKKNEKRGRRGDDEEKSAQVVVNKDTPNQTTDRSYWDTLRRNTSQALFSDLAERAEENFFVDTTLLVHFFGRRGKAELNFDDFYKFMDNIQTEILETEFLSYSKGMTTISEEDFARILLRFTNVDNTSTYLESVRQRIPEEKGITFDEFRSFFQFLNNLEDFAIAMQMYNFANRSIGQDEFKRAVYVATDLKLSSHLVNTVFKIFDVDKDDQLSYKEFIGVMKDRLHRGFRGYKSTQGYPSFKVCLKKEFVTR